jgi:hypothetical protein
LRRRGALTIVGVLSGGSRPRFRLPAAGLPQRVLSDPQSLRTAQMIQATLITLLSWLLGSAEPLPVTLAGSAASMERQHLVALLGGYEFLRRPTDVERAVTAGVLVRLEQTPSLALKYPREAAARPEVKHFAERFAREMHAACGERLVLTSLTRPVTRQPRNAHRLSVHPAGMAMDLRVPRSRACRKWLEGALLALEAGGVLDVTKERSPAHYHVALFPERYLAHVGLSAPRRAEVVAAQPVPPAPATPIQYAAPR